MREGKQKEGKQKEGKQKEGKQKKVDKSLDMTFPASDPPASNQSTGTEAPGRPASRQAPLVSKDEIDAAAGAKPPQRSREARKRHRGVGSDGLSEDAVDDAAQPAGPGREGRGEKPRRRRG
jgi:hypothetical protein